MSEIVCITNRHLYKNKEGCIRLYEDIDSGDTHSILKNTLYKSEEDILTYNLLSRVRLWIKCRADKIILREKDLEVSGYIELAEKVLKLCKGTDTECILHNFADAAAVFDCKRIHFPLDMLYRQPQSRLEGYEMMGVSLHSADEIKDLEDYINKVHIKKENVYINAGHIFETKCKEGLSARGVDFLRDICEKSPWKVYAIGGINKDNWKVALDAGAYGVCLMSSAMQYEENTFLKLCDDIHKY